METWPKDGRPVRKFKNYVANLRALETSKAALDMAKQTSLLEFVQSGIAAKFALQVELGWKLMRELLASYEIVDSDALRSPRSVIKEAASTLFFIDGDLWIEMLMERNEAAHRYGGDALTQLVGKVIDTYIPGLMQFEKDIKERYCVLSPHSI